MRHILVSGATLLLSAAAAPAFAQSLPAVSWYGGLGYSGESVDQANLGALAARLGLKLHPNFGVETELGIGTGFDAAPRLNVTTTQTMGFGGPGGAAPGATTTLTTTARERMNRSLAGYAVAYLPLTQHVELLARVGYGEARYIVGLGDTFNHSRLESINWGGGALYHLTGSDAVRFDLTRKEFTKSDNHSDVWSVSLVHRF